MLEATEAELAEMKAFLGIGLPTIFKASECSITEKITVDYVFYEGEFLPLKCFKDLLKFGNKGFRNGISIDE